MDPFVSRAGLLIAWTSTLALLSVFVAQYGFDLQPCVLCIWQRWPHGVAVALGLAVWAFRDWPAVSLSLLGLAITAELITGGIGVFHVGVEQGWWQGTAGCGSTSGADSLAALKAQIMNQPIVRCDEVAFAFLGVSMAGWNVVLAAVLAGLGLGAVVRNVNRRKEDWS